MSATYFLVERAPGHAFTTYRGEDGAVNRVPLTETEIGPFDSSAAAADWLARNAMPHASYEIAARATRST